MSQREPHLYEFGAFRLNATEHFLLHEGRTVPLPQKAFEMLLALVENSGHVVAKDDLMRRLWPDTFVEENNLTHYISLLRRTLSDGANGRELIETVPKRGYRFSADVHALYDSDDEVIVTERTRARLVIRDEIEESDADAQAVAVAAKTHSLTQVAPTSRRGLSAKAVALTAVVAVIAIAGAAYIFASRHAVPSNPATTRANVVPARRNSGENPAAREAYLKGRFFWNQRNPDAILKAEREFESAIEIDPNFAPAYSGMADCYLVGGAIPGVPSPKELALKALSLDEDLAEAHASLAYYIGAVEWDWLGAEKEFQRSISLDPRYPTARHWHAYNLASLGRLDEALLEIKMAEELDPLSVIIKTDVGHILYLAGRYDEAVTQYRKALEVSPDFRVAHWRLGEAYTLKHKYDEALIELRKALSLDSAKDSGIEPSLAYAEAVSGHRAEALEILNRRQIEADLRAQCYSIARIYAGLGDKESVIIWLEKSLKYHDGELALVKVDPMMTDVRSDPRFGDLLRRMGLPS